MSAEGGNGQIRFSCCTGGKKTKYRMTVTYRHTSGGPLMCTLFPAPLMRKEGRR